MPKFQQGNSMDLGPIEGHTDQLLLEGLGWGSLGISQARN